MMHTLWRWAPVVGLCMGLLACGGGPAVQAPGLDTVVGEKNACLAVEDPDNPYIVEWSNSATADLVERAQSGVVVVAYDGCRHLKILSECVVDGRYADNPMPVMVDSKRMESQKDLYAALPLAAARLKARVGLGRGIELTTVLTGRRRTQTQVSASMLGDQCPGASHYVSAMDLGAVALHQTSAVQTEAGVSVAGVGAGASNAKRQSAFAGRGDTEVCKTQGLGTGCNIPFRIKLKKLPGQVVSAPAQPVVKAAPPRPAAKVYPGNATAQRYGKACDGGDGQSCLSLALMYEAGKGSLPKSEADEVRLYRRACEQGAAAGCTNLGKRYSEGKGVLQDIVESVRWYQKGCDGGHALGCRNLGTRYENGKGVAQDKKAAARFYGKACEMNDAKACRWLAKMYSKGDGVATDKREALRLYRKACDGGFAKGCRSLGYMYSNGEGVATDKREAVRLYRKACDGGDAGGCRNLGVMYATGEGVATDNREAVRLFRKACDGGDADGCKNAKILEHLGY